MKRFAIGSVLLIAPILFGLVATVATPQVESAPQKQEKFEGRATGYVAPTPERRAQLRAISVKRHGDRIKRAAMFLGLPSKLDVREKVPIPMGDQGQCGSCYLYATMWYSFTDAAIRAGLGKAGSFKMSVQWGMDRPRSFGGCNGGWGQEVAEYVCNSGCIAETWVDAAGVTHNDYPPYEARVSTDRTKAGAKIWARGWTWGLVSNDNSPSIEEIKAAMNLYGRLNIAIDAGGQFGSGAGTITALGRNINHEISVCAYDDEMANPDGTKGAFLLENQWGKGWGNGGYRWCTYKASQNITDWFWVSAGVLPPPDPPVPGGAPVVTGGTVGAQVDKAFTYQIVATNAPTRYDTSSGLPPGLTVNKTTGVISGTPTEVGKFDVTLFAANAQGTGAAELSIVVGTTPPIPPQPVPSTIHSVTVNFNDGTKQTFYDTSNLMIVPKGVIGNGLQDRRWEDQQRMNDAFLRALEAIQKQLAPTKEKK